MSGDPSRHQTTVGPAHERGPLVLKGCDYAAAWEAPPPDADAPPPLLPDAPLLEPVLPEPVSLPVDPLGLVGFVG